MQSPAGSPQHKPSLTTDDHLEPSYPPGHVEAFCSTPPNQALTQVHSRCVLFSLVDAYTVDQDVAISTNLLGNNQSDRDFRQPACHDERRATLVRDGRIIQAKIICMNQVHGIALHVIHTMDTLAQQHLESLHRILTSDQIGLGAQVA